MLQSTTPEFYRETMKSLEASCDACYNRIERIVGLDVPTKPDGAMYMMVRTHETPVALSGKVDCHPRI